MSMECAPILAPSPVDRPGHDDLSTSLNRCTQDAAAPTAGASPPRRAFSQGIPWHEGFAHGD